MPGDAPLIYTKEGGFNMSYRLARYRVSLVREGSCVAEHNVIRTPEDVVAIMAAEYDDAVVEKAQMLALDTKNKIIGIFTISTGSLNASIVHPRDVYPTGNPFKRGIRHSRSRSSLRRSNPKRGGC